MTRRSPNKACVRPFLPQSTARLVEEKGAFPLEGRHPGLQLDKFSGIGLAEGSVMKRQKEAIAKVTKIRGDSALLSELNQRRTAMFAEVGARMVNMITAGPLTLHLSRAGTWENAGICLHPVYGFVYLPGSGIKGLVRSWAETVWVLAQEDQEAAWRRIEDVFGFSPRSEGHKFPQKQAGLPGWRPQAVRPQKGASAGRIVFHDAWPKKWPRLEVDIANNHHAGYYSQKDDPGDWENPNLVYFLSACENVQFTFAISDRKPCGDDTLELVEGWICNALQIEGAGAKTAAGYGRFVAAADKKPQVPSGFSSKEYKLELVTPAFLAGAAQDREDCTLRGATLRGLLRWWWRTMYAGKVNVETLRTLEAAVWGNTEQGSPVRIAVRMTEDKSPEQFSKSQKFLREHGILDRPRQGTKVTLGLYYASYGMAEKRRQRWYRPAGCRWQLVITARGGHFRSANKGFVVLSAKMLLDQASAALWLLAKYGGAGSKARKGFGSFLDITVPGIASIEDCNTLAQKFLKKLWIRVASRPGYYAPALEEGLILSDVATKWDDPFYACHQVGTILQHATKSLDPRERAGLGLPRRGADRRLPKRHASPVHWSLTRQDDDRIAVRLIAFPSSKLSTSKLPNHRESVRILKTFRDEADRQLRDRADEQPANGVRHNSKLPSVLSRQARQAGSSFPKSGTRAEVELLKEKTRRGKWKALHRESGLIGVVQDDIPGDVVPGQTIDLFVQYVNPERDEIAFRFKPQSKRSKTDSARSDRSPARSQKRRRKRR